MNSRLFPVNDESSTNISKKSNRFHLLITHHVYYSPPNFLRVLILILVAHFPHQNLDWHFRDVKTGNKFVYLSLQKYNLNLRQQHFHIQNQNLSIIVKFSLQKVENSHVSHEIFIVREFVGKSATRESSSVSGNQQAIFDQN